MTETRERGTELGVVVSEQLVDGEWKPFGAIERVVLDTAAEVDAMVTEPPAKRPYKRRAA